jgi:hypothetical protein
VGGLRFANPPDALHQAERELGDKIKDIPTLEVA